MIRPATKIGALAILATLASPALFAQETPNATHELSHAKAMSTGIAPKRHSDTITVQASQEDIYAYVSNNQNWVEWFPPYQSVETSEDGLTRTFNFADGQTTLTETLILDDGPNSFAWSFAPDNPLGVADHLGKITITPEGEGAVVTLTTFYNHPDLEAVAPQFEGGGSLILSMIAAEFAGE